MQKWLAWQATQINHVRPLRHDGADGRQVGQPEPQGVDPAPTGQVADQDQQQPTDAVEAAPVLVPAKPGNLASLYRAIEICLKKGKPFIGKGEAIEFGKHEALVEIENGRYRELYEMQFAAVASLAEM